MANNYRQLSEIYSLNGAQITWVEQFLKDCQDYIEDLDNQKVEKRLLDILGKCSDGNELEDVVHMVLAQLDLLSDGSLWAHGDEYVDVEVITQILQNMLFETDDPRCLTGQWAETCSKPRAGEFGGGWFAVSRLMVRFGNTEDAAKQAKELIENKEWLNA